MRLISCHDGKLLTLDADAPGAGVGGGASAVANDDRGFVTGLAALDALRQELKSKPPLSGSLDTQLVNAARGVWEEANPRRDLF